MLLWVKLKNYFACYTVYVCDVSQRDASRLCFNSNRLIFYDGAGNFVSAVVVRVDRRRLFSSTGSPGSRRRPLH